MMCWLARLGVYQAAILEYAAHINVDFRPTDRVMQYKGLALTGIPKERNA